MPKKKNFPRHVISISIAYKYFSFVSPFHKPTNNLSPSCKKPPKTCMSFFPLFPLSFLFYLLTFPLIHRIPSSTKKGLNLSGPSLKIESFS